MCTGFSFSSKNKQVLLGRTMDFVYQLEGFPAAQPRHYYWESRVDYKGKTRYGFIGSGCDMEGLLFGDGVNEHGLGTSIQYFRGYASYATEPREGYMNIAQSEVIIWVLGYNKNIDNVIKNAPTVNVIGHVLNDIEEVPPIHYHITDETGRTVELTFRDGQIVINENPLGVLTNNPDLNWHYENLRNFAQLTPHKPSHKRMLGQSVASLGNEGGTFGLPGGFTSGERFIRMAYLKDNLIGSDNPAYDVLDAFKLLDGVSIPKGAVLDENEGLHYTLYQTVLNLTTRTLFIKWYDTNQITELALTESLMIQDKMTVFDPVKGLITNKLN
ncbi:choloylglycine hydrolase family protein [Staphylococcus caeli]|uniref:Choloylglycine hydrolase n=1 Tax=Staphylococcus caeli TaxID=2201815 RepID=A0A1D4JQP7_9STAP|nr:choloylglycine hydrolase family protein [Staphylococcus caeli]SCS63998.1 choloylglycine hydrolase [Staphylococcus caeli]SCS88635.1 choloylglycine hydrolase [Staphylococcus caeli]